MAETVRVPQPKYDLSTVRCRITGPIYAVGDGPQGAVYVRPHGEQPEPAPVSVVGCPYCQRVPCEAPLAHSAWAKGRNGEDV